MKRSGLGRRSAIARRGGLTRTPVDTSQPSAWQPRRGKPIKVKRDGPPRRRSRSDTDHPERPWQDVRMVVHLRALGRCELCGCDLNLANMQGHHRLSRRYGPDCPCNVLALCEDCHHRRTHQDVAVAKAAGRIISQHNDRQPGEIPVEIGGDLTRLTCGGLYDVSV